MKKYNLSVCARVILPPFRECNLNGHIDSGKELFSNSVVNLTARGLNGMRWIDSNYDGKLTSAAPGSAMRNLHKAFNEEGLKRVA